MADEKTEDVKVEVDEAKAEDKPAKAEAKTAPRRGRRSETADDSVRESVLSDDGRSNWVDGKPQKIADPRTSTEAFGGDVAKLAGAVTAPTPWRETNPKLDNRTGTQQVTAESWKPEPQQVPGPEVGQNDPRVNNRG